MKVRFRDISSKKHGTRTQMLINIKSMPYSEEMFFDVMHQFIDHGCRFRCKGFFYGLIPSTQNYKYYTYMSVGETAELYERFSTALRFRTRGTTLKAIFNGIVVPFLPDGEIKKRFMDEIFKDIKIVDKW